jgi:large subunit ribosomal protein L17
MRHRKGFKKLNRTSSHRKAMFANMAEALLKHERIRTTLVKAKALRPYVEKIITKAKDKNLATIRYLSALFYDKDIVKKLTDDIGQRVFKRQGGYTRIYKIGFRPGDATDMALIELVDKPAVTKITENKKDSTKGVEKLEKTVESTDTSAKTIETKPKATSTKVVKEADSKKTPSKKSTATTNKKS